MTESNPSPLRILLTASGVCSLIVLDTNIVAVALPGIARDLGANFADIEWVVSAYMLAFAALLLPAGNIADLLGRKKMLMCGLILFIAASLACGAAPTLLALDLARAIKGVGAALLLTSALATIGHAFHNEAERAKAWAFWGACMGVTMTISPTLGGVIAELIGWRWIFYLNLPVGAALLFCVLRYIRESRNEGSARLDPWGSLAFSLALSCLIWGLIEAGRVGWGAPQTLGRIAGGFILLGLFVVIESVQSRPMVDLRLFRHPRFIGALLGMFFYAACAQVMMTLLPFYLQNGLDFSAIESGLGMLPFAVTMLLFPKIGARMSRHCTPAAIMAVGLVMVGTGNLLGAWATTVGGYPELTIALAITGAGAGLLNGDTQKNIMACVARERTGMASGLSTTLRFSAIMLGVGIYGALLATHAELALRASLDALAPKWVAHAGQIASRVAAGDMSAAMQLVEESSRSRIQPVAQQAFRDGFAFLLAAAGCAGLIGAALVGTLMSKPLPGTAMQQA